jgi:hypothetical protein
MLLACCNVFKLGESGLSDLGGSTLVHALGLPYIGVRGVGLKDSEHQLSRLLGLQKPELRVSEELVTILALLV